MITGFFAIFTLVTGTWLGVFFVSNRLEHLEDRVENLVCALKDVEKQIEMIAQRSNAADDS